MVYTTVYIRYICLYVCHDIRVYLVTKVASVPTRRLHGELDLAAADPSQLSVRLASCFPDLTEQPSITHKQQTIYKEQDRVWLCLRRHHTACI